MKKLQYGKTTITVSHAYEIKTATRLKHTPGQYGIPLPSKYVA